MDIARQATVSAPTPARAPALTVVTPQRGRGAMPTSEELSGLMTAVGAGDRQAFAVLFKHFAPRVKAYLMRAGTSPENAEELAQETMALVWRKAWSFDAARAGVSTWIFTIARNVSVDRHRRQGDDDEHEAIDLDRHDSADPGESPDEAFDARQRERRVRAALAQLSPEQARIIELSYFAESAHAAIAEELSIPLGTVKSRMRLAVNHLRRLLDGTRCS